MQAQDQQISEDIKAVKKEYTLEKHVQTILLSIITFGIITGIGKINNMNERLIKMEEREKMKSEQATTMQNYINQIQADVKSINDRLTRLENSKP